MEVKRTFTTGLTSVEVGELGANGAMGTSLNSLGLTYQDSCKIQQEDPEVTEHFAEEFDEPQFVVAKGGKTTISFSIMDPDLDTLMSLLGGTKTDKIEGENGNPAKWEAPATYNTKEMCLKLTPKKGLVFEFPRVSLVAKINGDFSKKGITLLEVNATVLTPAEGKSKMIVSEI